MTTLPYEYDGVVLRVVDGDTVDVELRRTVDFGFNIIQTTTHKLKVRLYGVNAPEMSTPEGKQVRLWLIEQVMGKAVRVKTVKDRTEKYGRYLATLVIDGEDINRLMVETGRAVEYYP